MHSLTEPRRPPLAKLAEYALAASIFAGSLVLWLGIPAGWLWLASQLSARHPTVYGIALIACPVTMVLWGVVLGRLNGAYLQLTGGQPDQQHAAWLRSLSGERRPRRPRAVLDVSMTISVILAMLVMAIWFFFYASTYIAGN